jgi:hypothetical protein
MSNTNSNSANEAQTIVTGTSLFHIASNAETTLVHLEQLTKMASEKLDNLSPYSDVNVTLSEAALVQTLLDAVALYHGKMGDMVEAVYQASHAMPKTKAELDALNAPDEVRNCA